MKNCIEAWLEDAGKPGTRVAYLHWFLRCAENPLVRSQRKQTAYLLLGYAAKLRFLHGNGRYPMTNNRRKEEGDIVHGGTAIQEARQRAMRWVARATTWPKGG